MAYEKYGKEKYTANDGNTYYAMQDITQDICDNVAIGTFEVPNTGILVDKRDGKTYQVSKLKMNPEGSQATCWMTQNLALNLSTTTPLTNEDTDLNSVTSWTPVRNTVATGNLNSSTFPNDNNTPYSYNSGRADYGVYYNWSAAVASNNTSSLTTAYTNAPDSICPKGWRLPQVYGGTSTNRPNEFGNLLYAYGLINNALPGDIQRADWAANGYNKIQQSPFSAVSTGHINIAGIFNAGKTNYQWSSTISDIYNDGRQLCFSLNLDESGAADGGNNSYQGFSVRCVLR